MRPGKMQVASISSDAEMILWDLRKLGIVDRMRGYEKMLLAADIHENADVIARYFIFS